MAGIIPGLLLGASLMILVLIYRLPQQPAEGRADPAAAGALKIALDAIWGLVTVIIIMGGILSGIFTPTESAAVACVWAFLVTMFIYRSVQVARPAAADRPRRAHRRHGDDHDRLLGRVRLHDGADAHPRAWPPSSSSTSRRDKYTFLLYVNILLLVLGTFMDLAPMLLICTPVFLPVIEQVRHRSGAFRHHHDLQSRHRIADAAGRADAGGRLRHRQGDHGAGIALDHDVLRADADRAAASSPTFRR